MTTVATPVESSFAEYIQDSSAREDSPHAWHIASLQCRIEEGDPLIDDLAQYLREAYGEKIILEAVISVEDNFDLERVREGIRKGLPDPGEEGNKPDHLKNFRSETAELLAKKTLSEIFGVKFPVHAQEGKRNATQPVLGFDAGGFVEVDGEHYLALVETKGTEDTSVPPSVVDDLAEECRNIPQSDSKISRSLGMIGTRVDDEEITSVVASLLEKIGNDEDLEMVISPVVGRGSSDPDFKDLSPVIEVCHDLEPNRGRGVSVSVGVELLKFAEAVTINALPEE